VTRSHLAAAVGVAVVWGVNFVVIHVGLQTTPALLLAALRFALVSALLAPFVRRPELPWPQLVAIGLTLYVGQFGLLFTAMDHGLSAGLAAVVLQSQAVFTFAGAMLLLGERPGRLHVAGVVAAACGLALIGADAALGLGFGHGGSALPAGGHGAASGVTPVGFALGLGAGLSWAVGNLVARRSGATQGLSLVVWGSVVAAPPLALLAVLSGGGLGNVAGELTRVGASGAAALGYLVVFATVLGFGTWSALIGRYPAATVAPFTMLVPPVGLLAAWVALGERPSPVALVGSACVVAGLVAPQLLTRRRRRAADLRPAGVPADQASGTISGAPIRTASAVSSSNCSCEARSAATRAR
jgi:O-acetylserine/cysteine efflux transporter